VWEVFVAPALFCIPMFFTLALMQHFFYAHRYPQLILNLLAGFSAYGVGVLWHFLTREPMGMEMRRKMVRYFAQAGQ
jgi:hypothetical protein